MDKEQQKHQLEHITAVRLTRECDQERAASKWRAGGIKRNMTSNSIRRVPLEWLGKLGLEDGEGLPLEVWAARASLKNGAGKGSSQERDKRDEFCAEHWRRGSRNVGTLRGTKGRRVDAQALVHYMLNARTGRKLRRELLSYVNCILEDPTALKRRTRPILVSLRPGRKGDMGSAYSNPGTMGQRNLNEIFRI
jgi:hypothetical protein